MKKNQYGTMGNFAEDEIRAGFYVRLALTLLHGDSEEYCKQCLTKAMQISKEKALADIDLLPCEQEEKDRMKAIAEK